MATLKKGLSKLNDGALVAKAAHVVDQLTANAATFPTPLPALAVITAAKTALQDAITASLEGSHAAYSTKRAAKKALKGLLDQAAEYVASVANGDETKIINGGFEVRKKSTPVGIPPAPEFTEVRVSDFVGAVDLNWNGSKALTYQVYMTTTDPSLPSSVWTSIGSTATRRFRASDLESGKAYWFKVAAVAFAGEGPACEPMMCRAA